MTPFLSREKRGPDPYLGPVIAIFLVAALTGLLGMLLDSQLLVILAILVMAAMLVYRIRSHRRPRDEAEADD